MKTTLISNIIEIKNLNKSFLVGKQLVPVLKSINLTIKTSEFTVIFGPSGCGKSTLLHSILGLEAPTSGSINFLNKNIFTATTEDDRSEFRKVHLGMVYQQPNWLKSLNVVENVAFPLTLFGIPYSERRLKAQKVLERVGMENWANYHPSELSSGQQQRVALARALITNPQVIITDEPTGNLDFESGKHLMQLLTDLHRNEGKTILMVTHDLEYLHYADISYRMFDGEIVETLVGKQIDKYLRFEKK